MFQGTGSNVGKSVLVAGFCRLLKNRGLKVLPFKPQNMSNNAAVAQSDDGAGGEIGRAQWLQALGCRVDAHVDMNPVLLKPQSETGAQIILCGKVYGKANAREYQLLRQELLGPVIESFNRLKDQADIVLVEGAGSPAEINLRHGDIANMGFARPENVPVIMVGDIDKGGVIASLVGTHTILEHADREQIKGFLVNKFRGDVSLFDEGRKQIIAFTGWQDFGILPWLDVVKRLPEEDSVWFDKTRESGTGSIKIVVPVCGKIANFDDFDPLAGEADVNLLFVQPGQKIPEDAHLIILAGSKTTIADMAQMEKNGWAEQIRNYGRNGGQIIGICGGYQMLGRIISDPHNIESGIGEITGLGLLQINTQLGNSKTTRTSRAVSLENLDDLHESRGNNMPLNGYEIHLGVTSGADCSRPMIKSNDVPQGACSVDGRIRGCYLHGLFGNDEYRKNLIQSLGGKPTGKNYLGEVDLALDELARNIEKHLDVDGLLKLTGIENLNS